MFVLVVVRQKDVRSLISINGNPITTSAESKEIRIGDASAANLNVSFNMWCEWYLQPARNKLVNPITPFDGIGVNKIDELLLFGCCWFHFFFGLSEHWWHWCWEFVSFLANQKKNTKNRTIKTGFGCRREQSVELQHSCNGLNECPENTRRRCKRGHGSLRIETRNGLSDFLWRETWLFLR